MPLPSCPSCADAPADPIPPPRVPPVTPLPYPALCCAALCCSGEFPAWVVPALAGVTSVVVLAGNRLACPAMLLTPVAVAEHRMEGLACIGAGVWGRLSVWGGVHCTLQPMKIQTGLACSNMHLPDPLYLTPCCLCRGLPVARPCLQMAAAMLWPRWCA